MVCSREEQRTGQVEAMQGGAKDLDGHTGVMLERDLHDLCQPVTSLQCRLELARMIGGEEALLEAAAGALEDTARIFAAVARMRDRLLAGRK